MRVDHSQARFSNHPGRDQLSQVGSQMNIITSKHTLLYNYLMLNTFSNGAIFMLEP